MIEIEELEEQLVQSRLTKPGSSSASLLYTSFSRALQIKLVQDVTWGILQ